MTQNRWEYEARVLVLPSLLSLIFFVLEPLRAEQRKATDFENPPVVSAASILPKSLMAGPHFSVGNKVRSNGYLNLYDLRSDYANYNATGTYELKTRIREIAALAELQRYTDSKVFTDAAKQAGVEIVTAPVKAVKAVAGAVTRPKETVKKIEKIPSGVKGLFEDIAEGVRSGAKLASDAVSGSSSGSSSEKSGASKAADKAVEEALDYSGYSKRESDWYRKLGVDPYTSNKPLRDKVARIVAIESVVDLSSKFVPGIPNIPGVGEASRYLSIADRLSLYADPRELRTKNLASLQSLGIPQQLADAFLSAQGYTPSMQTLIVDALTVMREAKGKDTYLQTLIEAKTRERAELYTRATRYLMRYGQSKAPFTQLLSVRRLPAGATASGEVVAALPIDKLYWTGDVAEVFSGYKEEVEKQTKVSSLSYHCAGTVSPQSSIMLVNRGGRVVENLEM